METMRFTRMRALVGVAVLSLALLAGIVGTTEPAAALPRDPGIGTYCDATGGDLSTIWVLDPEAGVFVGAEVCQWAWSYAYCEQGVYCIYGLGSFW